MGQFWAVRNTGVMLSDLMPQEHLQQGLLDDPSFVVQREKLNQTLDAINGKFGRGSLQVAAVGFDRRLYMKQNMLSPRYTTRWPDIAIARTDDLL